jgi:hypothetical protein
MLAAGGGLWAIVETIIVLVFVLQWKIRRRDKKTGDGTGED